MSRRMARAILREIPAAATAAGHTALWILFILLLWVSPYLGVGLARIFHGA